MDEYPIEEEVFVLQRGLKLGPFGVDALLDGLESGTFSYDDICLRNGATECERLKDFLDWDESVSPSKLIHPPLESDPLPTSGEKARAPAALRDGEIVVYAGHPSIMSSPLSLLCTVCGITGGAWLFPVDPTFTAAGIAVSLLGLMRLGYIRFTQDYEISPKRIGTITGLIARSSKEVRIEDIRAINVTCRGLSGMLGIGSVDFFTSGDSPEVVFRQIWAARKVKVLVRRLQDTP